MNLPSLIQRRGRWRAGDFNSGRTEMEDEKIEYAGFWARTGATLIDTVLVALISWPVLVAIYGWEYFDAEVTGFIAGPADFLVTWVLPSFAIVIFWIVKQATPGKMAVSARIVDAVTGKPASAAQLVGRYLAYLVSTIPLCLGFIWVAFDKRKQGWHDKLAGTVVVRRVNRGPEPVQFVSTG